MIEQKTHGGARQKSGPKPKSPTGDRMKSRAVRFNDSDWGDVLFVGLDRIRELIREEARRKRLIQLSTSAKPFGLYDGASITPDEFVKMMDF